VIDPAIKPTKKMLAFLRWIEEEPRNVMAIPYEWHPACRKATKAALVVEQVVDSDLQEAIYVLTARGREISR
jgi:hypothetical protein